MFSKWTSTNKRNANIINQYCKTVCKSQSISRFFCSITPQSFLHCCGTLVKSRKYISFQPVFQGFLAWLSFDYWNKSSENSLDIQHQAKDYLDCLNFKLGKLKEIHRRISRNSNTLVAKFPASRGLFSLVFGGPEGSRLRSCMFLLSFADLWLLYGFHWKRFVLSRFYLNPFAFLGFRKS